MSKRPATHAPTLARQIAGLRAYAEADKSDPHAFARGMAHIRAGIVGSTQTGEHAYYSAEEARETRTTIDSAGEEVEYAAQTWRNMTRP